MKVLCVGLTVCDILIKPVDMNTLTKDTTKADIIDICLGGDACNVAINLASLGIESILLSAVGTDYFGDFIINNLKNLNISTEYIIKKTEATSKSAVLITANGDRTFVSEKGACHNLNINDISDKILEKFDILYFGSMGDLSNFDNGQLVNLLKKAKAFGMKTVLDVTGSDISNLIDTANKSFKYLDYFIPSLQEAKQLSKKENIAEYIKHFKNLGVKNTIIKLGKEGCALEKDDTYITLAPFDADRIDTTGAGDAFVSGFIAALCNNLDIEECCQIGNYAGSIAIQNVGANANLPELNIIQKKVRENK